MYKVILTVLVIAILIVGYIVFKDVDFVPGQANPNEALGVIVQVQDSVKDTAGDIADMIGRESTAEYDTPEGLASKLWQWAKTLMQWLGTAGIVLTVSQFNQMADDTIDGWQKQEAYCHERKTKARKKWLCARCEDQLPIQGFVWKARFNKFVERFRFQDCTSGLYCDYCVDAEQY